MSEARDMEPAPRKPGWYTDPSLASVVRWWDGQGWTRHTAPNDARVPSRGAPRTMVRSLFLTAFIVLCLLGLVNIVILVWMGIAMANYGGNK